jgi:hypothetical protein
MKKPINENYAAIVVEIKTIVQLENCDNVQAAIIFGNQVIVSKDVKIGDVGLYFPLECALSKEYLSNNNLYRKDLKLNINLDDKGGFFDLNGRVRCQAFRGHKSEGLYMPLSSIIFATFNFEAELGDCFDELNGIKICSKYVVKQNRTPGTSNANKKGRGKLAKESKLIDNQFRFHDMTGMLYKNLHKIKPNDLISITYKMHGTSGISSKILCKRPLKWYEKVLIKLGVKIIDTEYDYIYSSRKVIKNPNLNPNAQHYYNEDIWGIAHKEVKEFLQDGMTFYYEIVGFLPSGKYIQNQFDYGCKPHSNNDTTTEEHEHEIRIYRITYTNPSGKVFEFSAKQVQDFCRAKGLKAVPQLYYGTAGNLFTYQNLENPSDEDWRNEFLAYVKFIYNEHDCYMCVNKLPEEGCVIRIEGENFEAYKQKSNRFYELETKELDKGEINIEEEN